MFVENHRARAYYEYQSVVETIDLVDEPMVETNDPVDEPVVEANGGAPKEDNVMQQINGSNNMIVEPQRGKKIADTKACVKKRRLL